MKTTKFINIKMLSALFFIALLSIFFISQQQHNIATLSPYVGNPIHAGTGNKYQVVKDYNSSKGDSFFRYYNSLDTQDINIGVGWRYTYSRSLDVSVSGIISAKRDDGKTYTFTNDGAGNWSTDPDVPVTLSSTATGWLYTKGNHSEEYDAQGKLKTISDKNGLKNTLDYDANNKLSKVTDRYSREIVFSSEPITGKPTVSFPGGESVTYTIENNNLMEALYADTTSRKYLYEDPRFPNALTGRKDEKNIQISNYEYDESGRANLTEKTGGVNKYILDYKPDGSTTVIDPSGKLRTYFFITEYGVTKVDRIEGGVCTSCNSGASATYDANGFLKSKTDHKQNITNYIYNAQGLQESRTEAVGQTEERTISTEWNIEERLPKKITEPRKTTEFDYQPNGDLIRTETDTTTTTNKTRTVSYTFNDFGQVLTVDGARTDVIDITTYRYDVDNNLSEVENALGHISKITSYDAAGRPLTLLDANSLLSTLGYDGRGRLKSRDQGGETTLFDYDLVGNLEKISRADGSSLTYGYDAAHRLTSIKDQLGNTINYDFDDELNEKYVDIKDVNNNLTYKRKEIYNDLNQLTEIFLGLNTTYSTTFGYDDNGNRTRATDEETKSTISGFDALNRLISVLDPDPLSGAVKYGYDSQDNLVSVEDVNGNITTYGYDGFGNRTSQISPDTGTTTFTFDEAGNMLSQTDAKDQTTTYAYDALNRISEATYADGRELSYIYDEYTGQLGRLTYVETYHPSDGWNAILYEYDLHGRLEYKEQMVNYSVLATTFLYDTQGRLQYKMYSPSGSVIEYLYTDGKLSGLKVNNTMVLNNIKYQPFAGVKSWNWGNGSVHSQDYNLEGRLISQTIGNETRTVGYDSRGNIDTINSTSINQLFSYDVLNRLDTASDSGFNLDFDYDFNGNRTLMTDAIAGTSDVYDYDVTNNNNRLLTITGSSSKSYQYDSNGNITNDGSHAYGYDARNRLTSVDTTLAKYQYNANGQRVQKETAERITLYYYNEQGQLIAEADQFGEIEKEIFYLGSQPVAINTISYDPVTMENVGTLSYIHTDHLGTPRVITDPTNNTPIWSWYSDPFGQTAANDDPDGDGNSFIFNQRFAGQYYDAETGLHYNYFRDYDPSTGRYVQSDPIGLRGGLNTYGYVSANPLMKIDPTGLIEICVPDPESPEDSDCGEFWPEPVEEPSSQVACVTGCAARELLGTAPLEYGAGSAFDRFAGTKPGWGKGVAKFCVKKPLFVWGVYDAAGCPSSCRTNISDAWDNYYDFQDFDEMRRLYGN